MCLRNQSSMSLWASSALLIAKSSSTCQRTAHPWATPGKIFTKLSIWKHQHTVNSHLDNIFLLLLVILSNWNFHIPINSQFLYWFKHELNFQSMVSKHFNSLQFFSSLLHKDRWYLILSPLGHKTMHEVTCKNSYMKKRLTPEFCDKISSNCLTSWGGERWSNSAPRIAIGLLTSEQ